MIEDAYRFGEAMGLSVWCTDQAGPFQTVPQPGTSWQPEGHPARQPHEYLRNGVAKVMTLFHPVDGQFRVKGVTSCPNTVLHGWLKEELTTILAGLPEPPVTPGAEVSLRSLWERWQADLTIKATLSAELPPLRMLLILDNLVGHKTPGLVCWLFAHGIMPLYTPLGGSWLNLVESLQRILKRRALDGQHPTNGSIKLNAPGMVFGVASNGKHRPLRQGVHSTRNRSSVAAQVWDLRLIRRQLATISLAWDWPALPATATPAPSPTPLRSAS